jgi:cupin domain
MRPRNSLTAGVLALAVVLVGAVTTTMAQPGTGSTPTLLARGTYDAFKVLSYPPGPGMFKAEAKQPVDVVVRRHDYAIGGFTGWHSHPYPVFITVTSGTLTFYEYDDPTCTPIVVSAGEGYVDSGRGHIGRNESGAPASDVSVIIAPVGAPFRVELPNPGPYCAF